MAGEERFAMKHLAGVAESVSRHDAAESSGEETGGRARSGIVT
jgi:hypothetical protein